MRTWTSKLRALLLALLAAAQPATAQAERIWRGRLGEAQALIVNFDRPLRAAFVNASANVLREDDPSLRALAEKYDAVILNLPLDWNVQDKSAQKILDALAAGARRFPEWPEFAHLPVVLFGFSASAAAAARTASSPLLSNPDESKPPQRVLAVVSLDEIDRPPFTPPLWTPHLFLSDPGDFYGGLKTNVQDLSPAISHDAYAKARARDGAPITVAAQLGHWHGGAHYAYRNRVDYSFMALWLDETLAARLPGAPPKDGPALLPSWRNHAGWRAAYDVEGPQSPRAPLGGDDERMAAIVAAPREKFADPRDFIWLPGERAARAWRYYVENAVMPPAPGAPLAVLDAFVRSGGDLKKGQFDLRLSEPGRPSCGEGALFVLFDRPITVGEAAVEGGFAARGAPKIWKNVMIVELEAGARRGPTRFSLRKVTPEGGGEPADFDLSGACQ